jgi:Survival motor neuron (SMN) interacting protein 1 (SIP1)
LQQTPPLKALEALGENHPTHVGKMTVAVARWWRWKMREVDPRPAQIASMDKLTVLRLLGLLTGGTLLRRGSEVEVGVSRWAWSLLARLPGRGELTSEEIGVVRELGKKAVLIGVGLRENKNWEEGMREVEKGFDEDEQEDLPGIVNDDEIELDSEDEDVNLDDVGTNAEVSATDLLSDVPFIGPQLVGPTTTTKETNGADISTTNSANGANLECGEEDRAAINPAEEEGELVSEEIPEGSDALAAARARILARLNQEQTDEEDNAEAKETKLKAEKQSALWNTRATVDMIITVAGEIYGQRDLLEFRGAWDE